MAFHGDFHEALTQASDSRAILRGWMDRYPQHAADLLEVFAQHIDFGPLPPPPLPAEPDRPDFGAVHRRFLDAARGRTQRPPITALRDELARGRIHLDDAARALRISKTILRKLDSRLIAAATLPDRLVQSLAEQLHRSASELWDYLGQPPTVASARVMAFKATAAPAVDSAQQDFSEALRTDPSLPEEDREHWLEETETAAVWEG